MAGLVLQVAVVDLNQTCGEECKAQLDAEFGEGQSIFIACDVTDGVALKGKTGSEEDPATRRAKRTLHW